MSCRLSSVSLPWRPLEGSTEYGGVGDRRGRKDRCGDEERPHARQQVAEVLADIHAKESMKRREHDLDRAASRRTVWSRSRHVAAGQLGYRKRPAHEPERLEQGPPRIGPR
jgi:hypothetical protein